MASLKRSVLRFSQAVSASGLKPKSLRNWLDRGIVSLFSERGDGWHAFSYADIAMLSLLAEMIRAKLPLATASVIARKVIGDTRLVESRIDAPANALLAPFTNKILLIWNDDDEISEYALISEADFFKKPYSSSRAVFVLRPAFIINNAFLSIEEQVEAAT